MPSYLPTLGKKAKRIKQAIATPAGRKALTGAPKSKAIAQHGGNPYGSLGPSPSRVSVVNKALLRSQVKPKVRRTTVQVDPLTALYKRLSGQVLSDEQMQKKATDYVNSQLNPNFDVVKQEAERLRGMAAGRRDALQAAYMAAAGANAQMAPQILAGFQSAASTLGGLSAGATGQVGAAQRADIASQNQALAAVGQAATQTGDPAQQQGVENYVGGYLPAANLAQSGAFAQQGFLGQVADQRMRAVSIPWNQYQETISDLDENELADLKDLALKRPELVGDVLEQMRTNQTKISGQMLDIEQERADRRQQLAKIKTAEQTLKLRWQEARRKAVTAADKAALDDWYKRQQVKLSGARNAISRTNAETGQQRADIAQQNADTAKKRAAAARVAAAAKAKGFKPVAEVMASAGRSRRDIPRGQSRAKIADALYQQYAMSVAPAQRPALKAALIKWVNTLPLQQKRGGKSSIFVEK